MFWSLKPKECHFPTHILYFFKKQSFLNTNPSSLPPPTPLPFLKMYLFYVFSVCLHVCMGTTCVPGTHGVQKRASNSLDLELDACKPPCGCWEANLDLYWGLLTSVPSLQPTPPVCLFKECMVLLRLTKPVTSLLTRCWGRGAGESEKRR